MMNTMQLIVSAESFVGVPFKEHGRSREGLDCYGLVLAIYKEVGVDLEDFFYKLSNTEDINAFIERYWERFSHIGERRRKVGDIVLFHNLNNSKMHVGIVLAGADFIHVLAKTGVVINKLSHKSFASRVKGYYRLKELCESV